jgi:uncharacterized membrane protein HdeD (DUF308 family)
MPRGSILGRLPWWVGLIFGAGCVVVGAVLTTRPFTSLKVLVVFVAVSCGAHGGTHCC